MKTYYLVNFNRKSGKINISLEGIGKGLLNLWALQNTTPATDTIVFEKESGIVDKYYTGTKDGFPEIEKDAGNIEDYCPGMLAVINDKELTTSE